MNDKLSNDGDGAGEACSKEEKLQRAIHYLDKKYVFHPSRRIPKGDYETILNRVDVAETVRRWREEQNGVKKVFKFK